jgi:hypothetical protein
MPMKQYKPEEVVAKPLSPGTGHVSDTPGGGRPQRTGCHDGAEGGVMTERQIILRVTGLLSNYWTVNDPTEIPAVQAGFWLGAPSIPDRRRPDEARPYPALIAARRTVSRNSWIVHLAATCLLRALVSAPPITGGSDEQQRRRTNSGHPHTR